LYCKGENDLADKHWNSSFENIDKEKQKALLLELYFYKFAHWRDETERNTAKWEVEKLLNEWIRSLWWDLSQNVKKAKEDGHSEIWLVEAFAKRIAEK